MFPPRNLEREAWTCREMGGGGAKLNLELKEDSGISADDIAQARLCVCISQELRIP
jgi:hypothetical protein